MSNLARELRAMADAVDSYEAADLNGPLSSRNTVTGWRQRYKRILAEQRALKDALRMVLNSELVTPGDGSHDWMTCDHVSCMVARSCLDGPRNPSFYTPSAQGSRPESRDDEDLNNRHA